MELSGGENISVSGEEAAREGKAAIY